MSFHATQSFFIDTGVRTLRDKHRQLHRSNLGCLITYLYPGLHLCHQVSRNTSSYAFVIIRCFCCVAEREGASLEGEEARAQAQAQAWQVALWLTAKASRKLQCVRHTDSELRPVSDLQTHFQLLWTSEITVFAPRNARIRLAFSGVEGGQLPSHTPGRLHILQKPLRQLALRADKQRSS